MIPADDMVLQFAARSGLTILFLSMALALYRIVKGPRHADRIIALDLLSILVVAFAALYSVYSGQKAFLDVAIAYALVAFLGTVALARYISRTSQRQFEKKQGDPKNG